MVADGLILFYGAKILVGIFMSLWFYRDAKTRDFAPGVWVLAPIAFVIPGDLLISALIGAAIPIVYINVRPRGALLVCPRCKKKVLDELAFCPHCRRSVKRECLRCHRTVAWDAVKCEHCGSTALTDE